MAREQQRGLEAIVLSEIRLPIALLAEEDER